MCREKGAVKHDDRLDCLAQGVKYFTEALAISAQESINERRREEWEDTIQSWLDDPQQACNHLALGFSYNMKKEARLKSGKNVVHHWI
jgi:hypothetical protein